MHSSIEDTIQQVLEANDTGDFPTEESWRRAWLDQSFDPLDPPALSARAGALADRPAWVFHGGYQGMLRENYPALPGDGWASLLVAEDREGSYPGCELKPDGRNFRLNGNKTWVAASAHVDHLVVRVRGGTPQTLLVARDAEGVALTHRQAPGFLPEMSQGFARFTEVTIEETDMLPVPEKTPRTQLSEALHVTIALAARFTRWSQRYDTTANVDLLRDALSAAQDNQFPAALRAVNERLQSEFQRLLPALELAESARSEIWQRDGRLVGMFKGALDRF